MKRSSFETSKATESRGQAAGGRRELSPPRPNCNYPLSRPDFMVLKPEPAYYDGVKDRTSRPMYLH